MLTEVGACCSEALGVMSVLFLDPNFSKFTDVDQ
jgi:hypothetical protein